MLIGENILLALNGLRANKMRSLLTMLGIIIGIASVIAIMTLGDSISSSVTESMSSMGANNVTIGVSQKSTTEETTASGMTFSAGPRFTQMSEDDYISEEMLDDLQERYTDSIRDFHWRNRWETELPSQEAVRPISVRSVSIQTI